MDLAKVLMAIVNRLTPEDLKALLKAVEGGYHAGAHLGTSSQLAAHKELEKACYKAIENMSKLDKKIAVEIIRGEASVRPFSVLSQYIDNSQICLDHVEARDSREAMEQIVELRADANVLIAMHGHHRDGGEVFVNREVGDV